MVSHYKSGLLALTAMALVASAKPAEAQRETASGGQWSGAAQPGAQSGVIQRSPTEIVQPATPIADELARHMRTLAVMPRDIIALLGAGKAALKLGDVNAAMALFARAENVSPRDGRVKAGMGSALLMMERPEDALRLFREAAALGASEAEFVSDRGLAYDLTGEPRKAQHDYALALQRGNDDETVRRYALSLGITGERDRAIALLDPLLRRRDFGAWRVRAFVLAMTGDAEGAKSIARSVMPSAAATAMAPFFGRLAGLDPVQKARAVHLGQLPANGARYAAIERGETMSRGQVPDSQLSSRLLSSGQPLDPRPDETATTRVPAPVSREGRRRPGMSFSTRRASVDRASDGIQPGSPAALARDRVAVAEAVPPPGRPIMAPAETTRMAMAPQTRRVAPVAGSAPAAPAVTPPVAPYRPPVAQGGPAVATAQIPRATPGGSAALAPPSNARTTPVAPAPSVPVASPPTARAVVPAPVPAPPAAAPVTQVPAVQGMARPLVGPPVPATEPQTQAATTQSVPVPPQPAPALVPPPPAAMASAAGAAAAASVPSAAERERTLAAIVADLKVPESELAGPPVELPAPRREQPKPKPEPVAKPAPEPTKPEPKAAKLDARAKPDAKAAPAKADAKVKADPKGKADPKAKAAELAKAKKKEPAKPKNPARHWVQVAGGANKATLPNEWKRLRTTEPKLFSGQSAWTTMLRATNRLLVGPFPSSDDAQAFVNRVAKAGLPAFAFTSAEGQAVEQLAAK